jgi:putative addiction module component (TIGR02574 family)
LALTEQNAINGFVSLGGSMTTDKLNRLRIQISTLSKTERAALAHEIIAGLDGGRDGTVEQAWDDEILRRMAQVESGHAELLTRDEFRQQMRSRMGS